MATSIMGYLGTTIMIRSFIPSQPHSKVRAVEEREPVGVLAGELTRGGRGENQKHNSTVYGFRLCIFASKFI